jgi:hypothetical protein
MTSSALGFHAMRCDSGIMAGKFSGEKNVSFRNTVIIPYCLSVNINTAEHGKLM